MKRGFLTKFLPGVLAFTMVVGNMSALTVRAESEGSPAAGRYLVNEDFSSDIWGSDAGWTVAVDDWTATGASVKSFSYSSDEWMNAPLDGSDNGVNFWFGEGDGTLTFSQETALEEGTYILSAELMGEKASFYPEINGDAGESTSLTGYNNWLTGEYEYTVSKALDAATVGIVINVEKDGWGYVNNIKLVRKNDDEAGSGSSDDDESGEASSAGSSAEDESSESSSDASSEDGGFGSSGQDDEIDNDLVWADGGYITNGDFETADMTGWEVVMPGADGETVGNRVYADEWATENTSNHFNFWNNNPEEEELSLFQTLNGVKAGTYRISLKLEGAEGRSGMILKVTALDGSTLVSKELDDTKGWNVWNSFDSDKFTLESDSDLTVSISGYVPAGYWGDLDDIALLGLSEKEEDTSVEAPIYVEKVTAADLDFITGVDVSSYVAEKNSGVKYYDFNGNELSDQGFFDFLKSCGVNYVRIRVWNDPTDQNGNSYGGGNCDLEVARKIGVWATNAGMKVLIDFHYSDFWADPGKQTAPKSMASMTADEKANAIETYTRDSLESLIDSGVNVGMVQIGNETNNGVAGEKAWENMAKIFSAGSRGVRAAASDKEAQILVAVHFTNPEKSSNYAGYAANLDKYGVDYDVFASSYYPYWHGTLDNLSSVLSNIANTYGKMVMVAETSYIHTWEDGDGHTNTEYEGKTGDTYAYDVSVQGQANAVRAVVNTVANIKEGIGVFYWEPAWIPVQVYNKDAADAAEILSQNKQIWETCGSGWASSFAGAYDKDAGTWYGGSAVDNEAWFDFEGHPLDSAMIYNYVRTGATAPIVVTSVSTDDVVSEVGQEIVLPATALVTYSDGSKKELPVAWNEEQLGAAVAGGVGSYEISGTVEVSEGDTRDVICKLTVNPVNNVANPGFEDADMSMWVITDANSIVGRQADSSNVRTGKYCLKFWDNKDINYTAEQTVTLKAGIYKLGTYIEGGDAGSADEFKLYAKVAGGQEYSVDTQVTGWQNWANPEVTDITVSADGTEVAIGVSVKAQAGAWGAWDDFYLYRTGDYEAPIPDDGDDEKAGITGNWRRRLGATYFRRNDGSYVKGLNVIDGKTYYFRANGTLVWAKFVKFSDGIRYFCVDGSMATGFVRTLLLTYYFDENGIMQTGRVKVGDNTYYFEKDGHMARARWLTENGKTYYFKADGRMATGKLRILFWTYRFDENGALIR